MSWSRNIRSGRGSVDANVAMGLTMGLTDHWDITVDFFVSLLASQSKQFTYPMVRSNISSSTELA